MPFVRHRQGSCCHRWIEGTNSARGAASGRYYFRSLRHPPASPSYHLPSADRRAERSLWYISFHEQAERSLKYISSTVFRMPTAWKARGCVPTTVDTCLLSSLSASTQHCEQLPNVSQAPSLQCQTVRCTFCGGEPRVRAGTAVMSYHDDNDRCIARRRRSEEVIGTRSCSGDSTYLLRNFTPCRKTFPPFLKFPP